MAVSRDQAPHHAPLLTSPDRKVPRMSDQHDAVDASASANGQDHPRHTVAFVGDSLTQDGSWADWFPDLDVRNLGRGGDTSDDLLARLDEVVATDPDEIVLLIGTNDLGTRQTVEHLVRNVETACVQLRRDLPGSRMLLTSILPRGREFAQRIKEANLWPALALDDGELNPAFTDDRLHLNEAGYQAWTGELGPALLRLRELPPMTTPIQIVRTDQYSRPPGA